MGKVYIPNVKPWEARAIAAAERHGIWEGKTWAERQTRVEARKAWDWWLREGAPNWWMEARYREMGKPWANPRLSDSEQYKLRYRLDPEFCLKERLRIHARKAERGRLDEVIRMALKRGGDSRRVKDELGWSIIDLKLHLERQFKRGMNWEKFADGRIHIDHRRPLSSFDLSDPDQARDAWSIANLQPMWAKDNIRKRDKRIFLL